MGRGGREKRSSAMAPQTTNANSSERRLMAGVMPGPRSGLRKRHVCRCRRVIHVPSALKNALSERHSSVDKARSRYRLSKDAKCIAKVVWVNMLSRYPSIFIVTTFHTFTLKANLNLSPNSTLAPTS